MKKIRSISLSESIDEQLEQDSKDRGLNISANVTRILYDYFQKNTSSGKKLPIIQK
tara:strand:- start:142 stop:309 length:168 start_codon:yes stop_codon:yes gene_type:complete